MSSTDMPDHATSETPDATPESQAQQPRPRRRGLRRALVAGVLTAGLVTAGGVALAAHKTIELDVDGVQQTVTTFAGSVQGLLDEQEIEPGEHDAVGPAPDEALSDGGLVVVRSAQQIEVEVNGEARQVWTTAETTAEAIHVAGEAGRAVTVSASRSLDGGRQALDLPLVDGVPVDVIVGDETIQVTPEGEADVNDVLELAEVSIGKLDDVVVSTSNDGTAQVIVTRVGHSLRTDAEEIPFETVEREDDSLYVGESRVVQEGSEGRQVRARLAVSNGEDVSVGDRSDYVTVRAAEDRIIAVGTKERPAPEPAAPQQESSASSGSSSGGSSGGSSSGDSSGDSSSGDSSGDSSSDESSSGGAPSSGVWAQLAQCESGGNPSAVSPNGLYHGLYQFSVETWQAVGGSGLPSQASPAEQTERAQMLQSRSGWGQWPACSAQLGLR